MPRRRKHHTLTSRDIKNLQKIPASIWLISLAVIMGAILFIIGFVLIISLTIWLNDRFELPSGFTFNFSIFAILALIVSTVVLIIVISTTLITKHNREIEMKYRGMRISNIDFMTGIEFEQYLERVLANQGYIVSLTTVSGDLGVDLVASGNGNKIAIQAKRYNNKVSRRAISDAVAGMYHYGCNQAMVITNNYFSPGAIALARSTGCILVDRDMLAKWVNDYQNPDMQITQPTKIRNER